MIGITDNYISFCIDLKLDIIFRKTTSHAKCAFPKSGNILTGALQSNGSKQKTKCQKNFHHQKLRQKFRLKCENFMKGEDSYQQMVISQFPKPGFICSLILKKRLQ